MVLPFELPKYHKSKTLDNWKRAGLVHDNPEALYDEYIYLTNCDLCGIPYKNLRDRQMEHEHLEGKYGPFRNFTCQSCNQRKSDKKIQCNNTSGYTGISKHKDKRSKQGFTWDFRAMIDGKEKQIKSSTDLDKLIEFAKQWKIDNNYHT